MTKFTNWLIALLLLTSVGMARAVSLEDAQLADVDRTNFSEYVRGSGTVLMSLYYVGSATEAVVRITSGNITAYAPVGTKDTQWNGDGTYVLTLSSYNTLGEVCSKIDSLASYNCTLKAGRPADNSNIMRDMWEGAGSVSSMSMSQAGGFTVTIDSGGASNDYGTGAVSGQVPIIRVFRKPAPGKRVTLTACSYWLDSTSTATITAFGVARAFEGASDGITRNGDTVVWGPADITTGSASSMAWNNSGVGGLEFAKDETAIVSIKSLAGQTQYFWSYLRCDGYER